MKLIRIIFSLFILTACSNKNQEQLKISNDSAVLHKDLYELNHKIMNNLASKSESDSAYSRLTEYLDVVTMAVIEGSGGQKAENGDLKYPGDAKLWVKALEEIEFSNNWKLGVQKIYESLPDEKALLLQKEGLKRINKAMEQKMRLDRLCIELRLLQYEVIVYWIESRLPCD